MAENEWILNELEQFCWVAQHSSRAFYETDNAIQNNNYFKLLLLKVILQATESWGVLTFPYSASLFSTDVCLINNDIASVATRGRRLQG